MDDIITSKSREVNHCPPHFIRVPVETKSSMFTSSLTLIGEQPENKIRNWCHENIEHRFFIGKYVDRNEQLTQTIPQRLIVESFVAAFEDPADATYFTLLLPSFLD